MESNVILLSSYVTDLGMLLQYGGCDKELGLSCFCSSSLFCVRFIFTLFTEREVFFQ